MPIEGVTVTKIIEPQQLGVHNDKIIYICYGKFGYFLRYDGKNYSIPLWAQKENLNEMFNLTHAINIIDWKMKNNVSRGRERLPGLSQAHAKSSELTQTI